MRNATIILLDNKLPLDNRDTNFSLGEHVGYNHLMAKNNRGIDILTKDGKRIIPRYKRWSYEYNWVKELKEVDNDTRS